MFVGNLPFKGSKNDEIRNNIQVSKPDIPLEIDESARNLITRLLEKDKTRRISIKDAMQHEYFSE